MPEDGVAALAAKLDRIEKTLDWVSSQSAIRDARMNEMKDRLGDLDEIIRGNGDRTGLLARVAKIEDSMGVAVKLLWIMLGSFLAGMGTYFFQMMVK